MRDRRMKLNGMMLSERDQSRKAMSYDSICITSSKGQSYRDGNRLAVARVRDGGGGDVCGRALQR